MVWDLSEDVFGYYFTYGLIYLFTALLLIILLIWLTKRITEERKEEGIIKEEKSGIEWIFLIFLFILIFLAFRVPTIGFMVGAALLFMMFGTIFWVYESAIPTICGLVVAYLIYKSDKHVSKFKVIFYGWTIPYFLSIFFFSGFTPLLGGNFRLLIENTVQPIYTTLSFIIQLANWAILTVVIYRKTKNIEWLR